MRDTFLSAYNNNVDDIFEYCFERVASRDVAKYLTRNIFMRTWDIVSSAGSHATTSIEKTLYRTADDHIAGFIANEQSKENYTENLWALTLSQ
jgi:hypothetical protein